MGEEPQDITWRLGSCKDSHWYVRRNARNKLGDMDKNGFKDIAAEFAPRFENLATLAHKLRNLFFPIRDGAIFTGAFHDNGIIYDGVIKAFNRVFGPLGKEE
jgi:hypothetical protein